MIGVILWGFYILDHQFYGFLSIMDAMVIMFMFSLVFEYRRLVGQYGENKDSKEYKYLTNMSSATDLLFVDNYNNERNKKLSRFFTLGFIFTTIIDVASKYYGWFDQVFFLMSPYCIIGYCIGKYFKILK